MAADPKNSDWRERLGRAGFAARGIVYGLVGIIAFAVAVGEEKGTSGQTGALRSLADSTGGKLLLVATAIGLAAYALYRLSEVIWGSATENDEKKEALERIASVARVAIYGGLAVSALRLLSGSGGSSGSPKQGTSTVFDLPAGQVLVFIAGAVMLGVAAYQAYTGLSRSFEDDLKTGEMDEGARKTARVTGVAGHLARSVVYALIGVFLLKAAIEHQAKEATGLDGALQEIAQQDYGSLLLGLVAAGLLVMGVYSLIEARYRRL